MPLPIFGSADEPRRASGLEIGGLIVRGAILQSDRECECHLNAKAVWRPGVPCPCHVAADIDLCPEGMPCGFRRAFHERLSEERRTLETPVHPYFLPLRSVTGAIPAYFGDPRQRRSVPVVRQGPRRRGAKHGPCPWQGVKQGEVGWSWRAARMALSKSSMACRSRGVGRRRLQPGREG